MKKIIKNPSQTAKKQQGAVSIEYAVLAAMAVGLMLVFFGPVATGIETLAGNIVTEMEIAVYGS
jgi:Flp pilus assembly pilin Flp